MHGFSHQFPITWENAVKSMKLGELGRLLPIFSPKYRYFSSIRFPSYVLHDMGNARVSPSISHSMGKCSKIHQTGRAWEIGVHFPPKVWVLFFHQIPILWYTLPYEKCMAFPINSIGKYSKIHPVSSQVVFPQYYCFDSFQNLVIP